MADLGVDFLLLSHGADLPWLTGYRAMPLERLTMLVVGLEGIPELVVPGLEAPKVPDPQGLFEIRPWTDVENPVDIVASSVASAGGGAGGGGTGGGTGPGSGGGTGGGTRMAVSDRAWAHTLLALQEVLPSASFLPASEVTSALRSVKDAYEVDALRAAGAAADRVAISLQQGLIPLVGRTERSVSEAIARRLLEEGNRRVNFAIVGSGPNGASPHHDAGDRRIDAGDLVVCDFGGELASDSSDVGYCSDITRTVVTGPPTTEVAELYEVLRAAQQAGVEAAVVGATAEQVDRAARTVIEDAGHGEFFIHRTGHGIGIEEHEDPYMVAGNETVLLPGHAFSVEPGIYFPGRFGMRLEDIVVVDDDGPERLNQVDHSLVVVEA